VVAGRQTVFWVASGLGLTRADTRITLPPRSGTIDTAPVRSCCFDDMALVDDGSAPPSIDVPSWLADSTHRHPRFSAILRASFQARSWAGASCPMAV
jgi:hypothetical protein